MTSLPVLHTAPLFSLFASLCLAGRTQDFCEYDHFEASCPEQQVILIQEALYGRMSNGSQCVNKGSTGCQVDVIYQLSQECAARSTCSFPVANFVSANIRPCQDDYRSYLQASYKCVPAIPVSRRPCQDVYHIDFSPVYLSSVFVADQNCGTQQYPVTIRSRPGQQLSVGLLDFSEESVVEEHAVSSHSSASCRGITVYSVIKDVVAQTSSQTLCQGDMGKRVVTMGNQAEVRVYTDSSKVFMLVVQAIGCADPPLSSSAKVARDGNMARISCPGLPGTRTIFCSSDGHWQGKLHNCTVNKDGMDSSPKASVMRTVTLSEEMSVLIITMVALFVGVSVLVVGIICLKRYSRAHHQAAAEQYWPPPPPELAVQQADVYKGYEGGGPNNEYYRTWQLQQHRHQAGLGNQHVLTGEQHQQQGDRLPAYSAGSGDGSRPTEHIYESPQFDRDSVYSAPEGRAASTATQSSSYWDLHQGGVHK